MERTNKQRKKKNNKKWNVQRHFKTNNSDQSFGMQFLWKDSFEYYDITIDAEPYRNDGQTNKSCHLNIHLYIFVFMVFHTNDLERKREKKNIYFSSVHFEYRNLCEAIM